MFLSNEDRASIEAQLQGSTQEEETLPVQKQEASTRAEDAKVEEKKDVNKKSEVSSTNDNGSEGHDVPYKRFKETIESKNALKAKNADLERQLAELRTKTESRTNSDENKNSKKADDPYNFDNFYKEILNDENVEVDEKYETLNKRLKNFEVKAAEAELDSEIKGIRQQYNVPETVLLQAVINDPRTNLTNFAKEYSQFIAEIEEGAIARHSSEKKSAPAAPRRVQGTGGTVSSAPQKPRSMAEARAAALAFIKTNGL